MESIIKAIYLSAPLITLVIMGIIWYRKGRDPKGGETIIPFYDIPEKLSPIEAGVLIDNSVDDWDISAHLIYCANNGLVEVDYNDNENDYILKKTDKINKLEEEGLDKKLIDSIFKDSDKIKLDSLGNHGELQYDRYDKFQDYAEEKLIEKGYYKTKPSTERRKYQNVGIGGSIFAYLAYSIMVSIFNPKNWFLYFLSPMLVVLIIIVIGSYMGIRTKKGSVLRNSLLGFKEYLGVAEAERINFHNRPENKLDSFSRLLPYVMIFGLESEWSQIVRRDDEEDSNGTLWSNNQSPEDILSGFKMAFGIDEDSKNKQNE